MQEATISNTESKNEIDSWEVEIKQQELPALDVGQVKCPRIEIEMFSIYWIIGVQLSQGIYCTEHFPFIRASKFVDAVSKLHKVPWAIDFEALKTEHVRPGSFFSRQLLRNFLLGGPYKLPFVRLATERNACPGTKTRELLKNVIWEMNVTSSNIINTREVDHNYTSQSIISIIVLHSSHFIIITQNTFNSGSLSEQEMQAIWQPAKLEIAMRGFNSIPHLQRLLFQFGIIV